jgi:hypothetical protein
MSACAAQALNGTQAFNGTCTAACVGGCWTRPWSPCLEPCTLCDNGSLLLTVALVPYAGRLLVDWLLVEVLKCCKVAGWVFVAATCIPGVIFAVRSEDTSHLRR